MLPPSQHACTVHTQAISTEIIPRDGCSQKQAKMKRSLNYKPIRKEARLSTPNAARNSLFNSQSIQRGENVPLSRRKLGTLERPKPLLLALQYMEICNGLFSFRGCTCYFFLEIYRDFITSITLLLVNVKFVSQKCACTVSLCCHF